MQTLSITNSASLANDGATYKVGSGDNIIFRNNVGEGNCARILSTIGDEPASAIVANVSPCRAGVGFGFKFTDTGSYKLQDNTYVGYFDTPVDISCEGGWDTCSNAATVFQNNIMVG